MDALFINHETNMASEVQFINRRGPRYRVTLRDLDSDMVVDASRFFETLEAARAYAEKLV
jgi:succinate dehydrogenase/fumarate reductase-like Fe-S protein